MARRAFLHRQEGAQPVELRPGKCLHVSEGVIVGEDRTQGDHHHLVDAMDDPPGHALIWEMREAGAEALDGNELIVGECFGI
ncbi:MAG: hypothetical protein ACI8T1_004016 [Verrucomicrobiales bacterium]